MINMMINLMICGSLDGSESDFSRLSPPPHLPSIFISVFENIWIIQGFYCLPLQTLFQVPSGQPGLPKLPPNKFCFKLPIHLFFIIVALYADDGIIDALEKLDLCLYVCVYIGKI